MPTTVPVYPLTLFYLTIGAFEPLEVLYCFSSRRPVGQVGWLLRVSLVRTNGWVSPRPQVLYLPEGVCYLIYQIFF